MKQENKNNLDPRNIKFSNELSQTMENLGSVELAPNVPSRLQPLLDHLRGKVEKTLDKMNEKGSEFRIYGPDWCRENPELAGEAHANVIIKTYGTTYALPNKNPEANVAALNDSNLDMYLLFENGEPVGTSCMVIQSNGWAELGRAASVGSVGNQVIQDLRIIRWLTKADQAEKIFGLFSTCRTAPDRNVGTEEKYVPMRGGQAVTHMWSQFPEVKIGGFGPLYKKHGALEQFAYAFVTNKEVYSPSDPQVFLDSDRDFVLGWASQYQTNRIDNNSPETLTPEGYSVHYPPLETKLTHLIHGEITLENRAESFANIDQAITRLNEVQVPFIQVQVPIDVDSKKIQSDLIEKGFQAFLFTPGIIGEQPPLLWFGKVTEGVSVVPTFWQNLGDKNPFWNQNLSDFASKVANKW